MKSNIPEELYTTAVSEIANSLLEIVGTDYPSDSEALRRKAEHILEERLELLQKENEGFERRLERAIVKAHHVSLRAGHYKGLRHQLRIEPGGVSKATAKAIVNNLFSVKGD